MKIVCDIDGTIANLAHRLHFIQPEEGGKKDWDSFFAGVSDDAPIQEVIHVVNALAGGIGNGDTLEFWTGRSESVREETGIWLHRYVWAWGWVADDDLKMRAEGDRRPDHIVKMEFIDPESPPDIIIEDRSSVVKAYRERGIRVLQVAEGNF